MTERTYTIKIDEPGCGDSTKKPVVMTIAGSDSGGGAGIQADIKSFAMHNVHGTCVIVSVTAQNTTGVDAVFDIPVDMIEKQFRSITADMIVSCAKTGMLSSPEIVSKAADLIRESGIPLIVDPVMASESGGKLLRQESVRVMKEKLLPVSYAVTPNIREAEILSGMKIGSQDDVLRAAAEIAKTGVRYVIVTGGHSDGTDLIYETASGRVTEIKGEFVKGGTHGTGCTYSSSLAASTAKGLPIEKAAEIAKKFVVRGILHSSDIGRGVSPINAAGFAAEILEKIGYDDR